MSISLTPDQLAWIEGLIASGEFESVEEAVRQLIDEARLAALEAEWQSRSNDRRRRRPRVARS